MNLNNHNKFNNNPILLEKFPNEENMYTINEKQIR